MIRGTLFPERLDELIGEDNAVRVIGACVDSLELQALEFARIEVKATGRPPPALSAAAYVNSFPSKTGVAPCVATHRRPPVSRWILVWRGGRTCRSGCHPASTMR